MIFLLMKLKWNKISDNTVLIYCTAFETEILFSISILMSSIQNCQINNIFQKSTILNSKYGLYVRYVWLVKSYHAFAMGKFFLMVKSIFSGQKLRCIDSSDARTGGPGGHGSSPPIVFTFRMQCNWREGDGWIWIVFINKGTFEK